MEMDPQSPAWQRIFQNPMALVAFKSTEPWYARDVTLSRNSVNPGELQ